ncbi:uncharacterized protein SAPINGB_P000909 [Magnusiomyces paraingens]|uniref:CNH domain-containing protein n=1 Tax=Magnusiomyces paraingens TaxID=2606893 RepID=A0A5E8B309_9ASCO|nr:uncharacterized protein SAPINGB_P000909 [Saprochaete ingens]VVT45824.1 unnamed protein product [Saprochaete ingens]
MYPYNNSSPPRGSGYIPSSSNNAAQTSYEAYQQQQEQLYQQQQHQLYYQQHQQLQQNQQQQIPPPLPPKDNVQRQYRYANGSPLVNVYRADSSSPTRLYAELPRTVSPISRSNVLPDPFTETMDPSDLEDSNPPNLPPKPTQYKTVIQSLNNGYSYKLPHSASPIYLYGTQNTIGLAQTNINNTTTAYIPHYQATSTTDYEQQQYTHESQYSQYVSNNTYPSASIVPTNLPSSSPNRSPPASASGISSIYTQNTSSSRSPIPLRVDTTIRSSSPTKQFSSSSSSQQSTPLDRKPLGPRLPPSSFSSSAVLSSTSSAAQRSAQSPRDPPQTPNKPTHRHSNSLSGSRSTGSSSGHSYSNSLGNLYGQFPAGSSPPSYSDASIIDDPYRYQSFDHCSIVSGPFVSTSPLSLIKRKDISTSPTHSHSKSIGSISNSTVPPTVSKPNLDRHKSMESNGEVDALNSSGHSGKSAFSTYSNISSYSSSSYSPQHVHPPPDAFQPAQKPLAYPIDETTLPYPVSPISSSPPKKSSSRQDMIESFANFSLKTGEIGVLMDSTSSMSGDTVKSSDQFRMHRSQTYTDMTDDHHDILPPPTRSYSTISKSTPISKSSMRSSLISGATDYSLMLKLDLPSIPDSRTRLDPDKLSSRDFDLCETPWAISSICLWIEYLNTIAEMSFETLSEALINLFCHIVPTLGWVAAERITVPLLESLTKCSFLTINEDTGVLMVNPYHAISGVLPSITGRGCYSSRSHQFDNTAKDKQIYRCYSSRCSRTIPHKPVLPNINLAQKFNDSDRVNWAKIWNLSDDDLSKLEKKVIERQCAIQELIGTEEIYVRGLKAFLNVYGDYLNRAKPPVVSNQARFWNDTFGCIQGLIDSNDNQLLTYLKIRQAQQGPFIQSIADLVLNWLKAARTPYLQRASTYSYAMRVVSSEKSKKNELFAAWLDKAERDPRLTRVQKFDFLMSSPFMRLCRYNLLFDRIRASTPVDDPEYRLWGRCIDECRIIVEEYNRIHGESEDISSIMTLEERITFPNLEEKVDLRLRDSRRKIYYEGDVLRKGEFGLDYVDTHMVLLDNYLILAKVKKDNLEKYMVTKRPIPLELLVIEQADGEPVIKSNTKMLTGVLSGGSHDSKKQSKNSSSGNGSSGNGNGSNNGTGTPAGSGSSGAVYDNENIIYPIKVRDLGATGNHASKAVYYLYTQTDEERRAWVSKMLLAKRDYSSAAFAQNSEPFRVRVVEDRFFSYDNGEAPKLAVYAESTALDRGICEYEAANGSTRVGTLTTATSRINCSVTCSLGGKYFMVVGLENGIYACDMSMKKITPADIPKRSQSSSPHKGGKTLATVPETEVTSGVQNEETATWVAPQWVKVLDLQKTTQLEILTDYNVLIVLSERTLAYYPLDQILAIVMNNNRKPRDSNLTGYAISRAKEVTFFATGYMSSGGPGMTADSKRQLVFYNVKKRGPKDPREAIKKNGGSMTVEVVEPVKERGSQKKRSHFIVNKSNDNTRSDNFDETGAAIRSGTIPNRAGISNASTEYFREYDSVTVNGEIFGITLFGSTFFAHTGRGFEILALSYKIPRLVPDAASISHALNRSAAVTNKPSGHHHHHHHHHHGSGNGGFLSPSPQTLSDAVRRKIDGSKPVGAFMINDNCILLVYEQIGIFVDKFGEMSSPIVINLLARAKSALVSYPYLLLFSDEMIEVRKMDVGSAAAHGAAASRKIRNAAIAAVDPKAKRNSKIEIEIEIEPQESQFTRANLQGSDYSSCELKQVITGKHIRLVVDGSKRSKQGQEIMISMAHPKYSNQQLLVELVPNEFVVEDDNSSLLGL